MSNSDLLDSRYGKSERAKADRKLAIGLGGFLLIAGLIWIGTVVFLAPPQATGVVVGFSYSENQAVVKIQVTKPADATATCGVSAQNAASMNVGFKQVKVPAGLGVSQLEVPLRTTEDAVSGVVDICTLN